MLNDFYLLFDLRHDGGKRTTAIAGFIFNSVPAIGIVAGGDDHSAGGVSLANQQRDSGRGAGLVGQPYGRAACGDNVSDCCGHSIGCEAMIVADDYASARVFGANYVASDGARNGARVRKSEVFGNDGAPAVGAEFNWRRVFDNLQLRHHTASSIRDRPVAPRAALACLQQVLAAALLEPFHDFADVLGAMARADQQSVSSFDHYEIAYADGGDEFCGAQNKIAFGFEHVAGAGEDIGVPGD